jgi:hypothetical protein
MSNLKSMRRYYCGIEFMLIGEEIQILKIMAGSFQDRFCPGCKFLHSKGITRAIVFLQH